MGSTTTGCHGGCQQFHFPKGERSNKGAIFLGPGPHQHREELIDEVEVHTGAKYPITFLTKNIIFKEAIAQDLDS